MEWAGRRVFVTGHTGFKGGWLALQLCSLGAVVRGYALDPPTSPSLFETAAIGEGIESVIGDVRDADRLAAELRSFAPEIVLHLAAQPLVRLSYAQPLETYAVNVLGTAHLLEAVRAAETVRAVVIVTTDKCYENRESLRPYRESDRLGGHDPYSSSKAAAELVTASYRDSFFPPDRYDAHGVAVATARAGNVIGGGDWAVDRLIPDIMRASASGETVHVRNPRAVRPWQHVLEPLRGYLMLAEALYDRGPAFNGAWNFGPAAHDALPVEAIVQFVAEELSASGRAPRVHYDRQPRLQEAKLHEAGLLCLDCSKAAAELAWQPALSITQALRLTVDWYAAFYDGKPMRAFTCDQIEAYEHAVRSPALDRIA